MDKYGVRVCETCGGQTGTQAEVDPSETSTPPKLASDGHACSCTPGPSVTTSPAASGADQTPDNAS